MALDGFFVSSLAHVFQSELDKAALSGGSFVVDKIHQPDPGELDIYFRLPASSTYLPSRLILNASASGARFQLSKAKAENPAVAPNFCMICRKVLEKAHLMSVEQLSGDRIARFTFETINTFGDFEEAYLILEMMGKHSNLILVNSEGRVIDALYRVSSHLSSVRTVEPGDLYTLAPQKNKVNPFELMEGDNLRVFLESGAAFGELDPSTPLEKALVATFNGLSPQSAKEIVQLSLTNDALHSTGESLADFSAEGAQLLADGMRRFYAKLAKPAFTLYKKEDGQWADYSAFLYESLSLPSESFDLWAGLDTFYSSKETKERIHRRSHDLHQLIRSNIDRVERKLTAFHEQLDKTTDLEDDRLKAELLTANLYRLEAGNSKVLVENYYETDADGRLPLLEITLNPALGPSENAQNYYKRYNKKKRTQKSLGEQLILVQEELAYLQTLAYSLEASQNEGDLDLIRKELVASGYLRAKRKAAPPSQQAKILSFKTTEGLEVLIGKNNFQNDQLTFKTARSLDLWLHVKDRPGSHCILRAPLDRRWNGDTSLEEFFGPENIKEAAEWAALYSSVASDDLVQIDYTLQKYVKKPAGSKPGFVIYTHEKAVFVHPKKEVK